MPFKQVVSKSKRPADQGQSSRDQPPPKPRRSYNPRQVLSPAERWALRQRFSEEDLEWMLHNEDLQICDFIDLLLAGVPSFTKDDENNIYDDVDFEPKLRWCVICHDQGPKHGMAKCRMCYEWSCFEHYDIGGRANPRRRFWKCPGCLSRNSGGPSLHTATPEEIHADNLFEDTDNERVV